jgi:hypothetical protein
MSMLTINREICEDLLCEKMNQEKGYTRYMTNRQLKKFLAGDRPDYFTIAFLKEQNEKLKEENEKNKKACVVAHWKSIHAEEENKELKEEAVENKKLFDTTFGEMMKLKEYKDHSEKCWGDLSEEIDGERDAMRWAEVENRIKEQDEENEDLNAELNDRVVIEDIAHLFGKGDEGNDFDWESEIGGLVKDNKELKEEIENLHDQLEDTDDDELIDILGCQHCDRVEAVAQWRDDITDLREEIKGLQEQLNEESQQRLKNKECWMSVQKQYHELKEENKKLKKRATMWKYMSDYIEKSDPSAYWDFIRDEYPDEFVEAGGVIDSDEEVE